MAIQQAEQVIEFSAYGALLSRAGNRGPKGAPQNVYRTADTDGRGGSDSWVAIAVETDTQCHRRARATGLGPRSLPHSELTA